jgi:hypothetical protein
MVQPMGGLPWATTVTPTNSTTNASNSSATQTQTASGESAFAEQLAGALQTALNQSGNGSQFEINIQPGTGADANQYTITVTENGGSPATPAATANAATSITPTTTPATTPATTPTPASTTTPSSAANATTANNASSVDYGSPVPWTPPTFTPAQLSTMTPADVYWAEQPPAVQQLRYMQVDERGSYAETLAAEGYTIDVPIMVDGGDPLSVMIQREIDGYTWVPSALQPNIPAGPGMDVPGEPEYAANNPPAGSIQVTTAFALGTDISADPVVSASDAQNYVLNQASSATIAS